MPSRRAGSGRTAARVYDVAACEAWARENVRGWAAARDAGPAPSAPPETRAAQGRGQGKAQVGYEAICGRLGTAEALTYAHWASAVQRARQEGGALPSADKWLGMVEQFRKLSKDLEGVRKQDAAWLPRERAEAALTRMATEVRHALLALPRAVAPRCEGLAAGEIERTLDEAVRDALSLLADPPDMEADS